MKTIKIKLDSNSIDKAINELRDYRNSITEKLKLFTGQLIQEGVQVARVQVLQSQGDSDNAFVDYLVSPEGEIVKAAILLQGTDVLFIEFGAGIYYNNGNSHPMATEFGYGVGTYPGQTHAIMPGYWWYRDEDKTLRLSFGTEATMPMYKAAETMRNIAIQKAIEIFRS